MIKMLHEAGRAAPILVCDVCGHRIEDAGAGAALTLPPAVPAGGHSKVMHVHEETCHAMAESHYGHGLAHEPLGAHLLRLVQNVSLSPEGLRAFDHAAPAGPGTAWARAV